MRPDSDNNRIRLQRARSTLVSEPGRCLVSRSGTGSSNTDRSGVALTNKQAALFPLQRGSACIVTILLMGALFGSPVSEAQSAESAETPKQTEPGTASAQPVEQSPEKPVTTSRQTQPQAQPKTIGPKAEIKSKAGDVFKPSEEISEDYAVPFPVDI